MKKYISQTPVFICATILLISIACNESIKKVSPTDLPKLIKTIGGPRYGNVQCSLQDKDGNLWFGTTQNGLYKYDGKSFIQYLVADGLNSNNVYSLLEDKDGKMWIGTEAGLCIYDGKAFDTIQIPLPKNLPANTHPNYLNLHWVYSLIEAKDGKIWVATIDGVYVYDGKSFMPFYIDEANGFLTSSDKAERIFEDDAGNIWFGGRTNAGVFRYDGTSVTKLNLEELNTFGPDSVRKGHSWGWPQVQDKNGHIWFSNWAGVYRYDGKSFKSFTKEDGIPPTVTKIIEDRNGNLWFGGGDGLSRYDGKSFTRFPINAGSANTGVWSILEDRKGNLWVGTRETSLYLFDGKSFVAYSEYRKKI